MSANPISDNDLLKSLDFLATCYIGDCQVRMSEQFVMVCVKCKCVDSTTMTCSNHGAILFDLASKNTPVCHCGGAVTYARNLLR